MLLSPVQRKPGIIAVQIYYLKIILNYPAVGRRTKEPEKPEHTPWLIGANGGNLLSPRYFLKLLCGGFESVSVTAHATSTQNITVLRRWT